MLGIMRATLIIGCIFLFLFCGCQSKPDSHTSALVPAEDTGREIVVGMSMEEVIKLRGRHYRSVSGPRLGDIHLVYDDITVQTRGGAVYLVGSTPPDVGSFLGKTPYEDTK
jgi:hypothetical protein